MSVQHSDDFVFTGELKLRCQIHHQQSPTGMPEPISVSDSEVYFQKDCGNTAGTSEVGRSD